MLIKQTSYLSVVVGVTLAILLSAPSNAQHLKKPHHWNSPSLKKIVKRQVSQSKAQNNPTDVSQQKVSLQDADWLVQWSDAVTDKNSGVKRSTSVSAPGANKTPAAPPLPALSLTPQIGNKFGDVFPDPPVYDETSIGIAPQVVTETVQKPAEAEPGKISEKKIMGMRFGKLLRSFESKPKKSPILAQPAIVHHEE